MPRYILSNIIDDLKRKMVFVAGPRQVGKTTLARSLLEDDLGYLSWDVTEHRQLILKREFPNASLIVLDEIHKYRTWRNYLKGIYDNPKRTFQILVTGSAKLDLYRRGGDSLQGRYHFLRLHPLSVAELKIETASVFSQLLELGGFPEPFFGSSLELARRWSREYSSRLIREEVTSLEQVLDLGNMELLLFRLPDLIGSPLSINALREDLQVSHHTVVRWLNIFDKLYASFRLPPYGSQKIKAVKKEQKLYLFDWSVIQDQAAKFENLVACHLLKWVHFEQDTKGRDLDLHYLRDITGREVDFLISERRKPLMLIECKLSDTSVGKEFHYFKSKFPDTQAFQISANGVKDYQTEDGIRVCNALVFLRNLV